MAMANKDSKLSGVEKAAVLMMNIGEDLASEIFKHLSSTEMQLLGGTIVKRESVPVEVAKTVVNDFFEAMRTGDSAIEGMEYAKGIIRKALGHEAAEGVIESISRAAGKSGIEALKWMDPAIIANIIKSEHPQIIALILIHLDPVRAAHVLLNLPDERMRGEIMLRVATLKRVPLAAVRDLENLLSEQMLSSDSSIGTSVEGIKTAAEILNSLENKQDGGIMDVIEKANPDIAIKIQEMMFLFSDLMTVSDRGLQLVIKEITGDVLATALKGAEDALKEKFLKNMSERASEMLREDMENKGPVKVIDVEKAQQEIVKIARRLEQEGKLVRAGKGGDVIV